MLLQNSGRNTQTEIGTGSTIQGHMATGWKKIAEKWYYFDVEGAMKTGWVRVQRYLVLS